MLAELIRGVEQKKMELDRLRPLSGGALAQLQQYYDVELTYTSNAIEGNTLTHRETAEVIEHGITVGGKSLREHLEAVDHYEALQWMRGLAAQTTSIGEDTVCELHRRIVARSQPAIAGIYSRHPCRIAGDFSEPFEDSPTHGGIWSVVIARTVNARRRVRGTFSAHCDSSIQRRQRPHRTFIDEPHADPWRLSAGCRPSRGSQAISRRLERGSLTDDPQPCRRFMYERLDATLGEYLSTLQRSLPQPDPNR
jgi:hypothetical protein